MLKVCGGVLTWEGLTLRCDRFRHGPLQYDVRPMRDHHMLLTTGQHVWWADGIVETVTDGAGVAVSLLPPLEPPPPKPVKLDAQGYRTRNTKQRRTDRPVIHVLTGEGTRINDRNWYLTP